MRTRLPFGRALSGSAGWRRPALILAISVALLTLLSTASFAQQAAPASQEMSGEAGLKLPDLSTVTFLGLDGHSLLLIGILFCIFGLLFAAVQYIQLKNLTVHRAMREMSELIYETCKTYLVTQGKFLAILWAFIAVVIVLYFGVLLKAEYSVGVVLIILGFSVVGILGSYGVAWFGIRVNCFANSRTAFAGLKGKPYPCYAIPTKSGMSIGMALISVELLIMLI
ncbi:MAG: sodium/proton-translocating pyrophosphatase, partial [Terriglobales bacterium]